MANVGPFVLLGRVHGVSFHFAQPMNIQHVVLFGSLRAAAAAASPAGGGVAAVHEPGSAAAANGAHGCGCALTAPSTVMRLLCGMLAV